MELYSWISKGKDWFAIKGDSDILFESIVEFEMILNDQAQSENWLAFWLPPHHAEIIRDRYPVFFKRPKTDIAKTFAEENIHAIELAANLEQIVQKDWGKVDDTDMDLKNILRDAEKELTTFYKQSNLVFSTPLTRKVEANNEPIMPKVTVVTPPDSGGVFTFEDEFADRPVNVTNKLKDKFGK